MSVPNEKSWKVFEKNIETHSAYLQIPAIKIPEKVVFAKGRYIRVKSPIDFTACVDGEAVYFDAKCESIEDRHYFAKELEEGRSFKKQWETLARFHDQGAVCGLLIWFKEKGRVAWVDASVLKKAISDGDKSITFDSPGVVSQEDCEPINLRELTKGVRKCKCQMNKATR